MHLACMMYHIHSLIRICLLCAVFACNGDVLLVTKCFMKYSNKIVSIICLVPHK